MKHFIGLIIAILLFVNIFIGFTALFHLLGWFNVWLSILIVFAGVTAALDLLFVVFMVIALITIKDDYKA